MRALFLTAGLGLGMSLSLSLSLSLSPSMQLLCLAGSGLWAMSGGENTGRGVGLSSAGQVTRGPRQDRDHDWDEAYYYPSYTYDFSESPTPSSSSAAAALWSGLRTRLTTPTDNFLPTVFKWLRVGGRAVGYGGGVYCGFLLAQRLLHRWSLDPSDFQPPALSPNDREQGQEPGSRPSDLAAAAFVKVDNATAHQLLLQELKEDVEGLWQAVLNIHNRGSATSSGGGAGDTGPTANEIDPAQAPVTAAQFNEYLSEQLVQGKRLERAEELFETMKMALDQVRAQISHMNGQVQQAIQGQIQTQQEVELLQARGQGQSSTGESNDRQLHEEIEALREEMKRIDSQLQQARLDVPNVLKQHDEQVTRRLKTYLEATKQLILDMKKSQTTETPLSSQKKRSAPDSK